MKSHRSALTRIGGSVVKEYSLGTHGKKTTQNKSQVECGPGAVRPAQLLARFVRVVRQGCWQSVLEITALKGSPPSMLL